MVVAAQWLAVPRCTTPPKSHGQMHCGLLGEPPKSLAMSELSNLHFERESPGVKTRL